MEVEDQELKLVGLDRNEISGKALEGDPLHADLLPKQKPGPSAIMKGR